MSLKAAAHNRYSGSTLLNFYRKEENTFFNFRMVLIALGIFIALMLVFFVLPNYLFKTNAPVAQSVKNLKLTNAQILTIAAQHPLAKEFILQNPAYKSKITFLDEKAIQSLIATSPAIYADLNLKEVYKVEYTAQTEGIMLLIDPLTKSVAKYYRVKEIQF